MTINTEALDGRIEEFRHVVGTDPALAILLLAAVLEQIDESLSAIATCANEHGELIVHQQ